MCFYLAHTNPYHSCTFWLYSDTALITTISKKWPRKQQDPPLSTWARQDRNYKEDWPGEQWRRLRIVPHKCCTAMFFKPHKTQQLWSLIFLNKKKEENSLNMAIKHWRFHHSCAIEEGWSSLVLTIIIKMGIHNRKLNGPNCLESMKTNRSLSLCLVH